MALRKEEVLGTIHSLLSESDGGTITALDVAERLGIDTDDDERLSRLFAVLRSLRPNGIGFNAAGRNGAIFKLR